MPKALDRLDRRILDELQVDARVSNQELAKRVGLSPAPCWRRLQRLGGLVSSPVHVTCSMPRPSDCPCGLCDGVARESSSQSVKQFDQMVRIGLKCSSVIR